MTKLNKDVMEMTNIEIKDEILKNNKVQLKDIKKSSYFNVFHSILGIKKILGDKISKDDFEVNKELNMYQKYMEETINSVGLTMEELSEENQNLELEKLKKRREELHKILSVLDGYLIAISYIEELIDEYGVKLLAKRDYSSIPSDHKKINELINSINQILEENKDDYSKYIYIISEIISILPMRLVKDNYFTIIKETLMRNLNKSSKLEIEMKINKYKKEFNSTTRDGYGTEFDYLFIEIQKLRNDDFKNKNLEELSGLINKNIPLKEEINELIDLTYVLGLTTNMNIVIILMNHDSKNKEIERVYKEWKNLLEGKDEKKIEKFILKIQKEIKNTEKDIFKDIKKFEILNQEGAKREGFNYEELNKELLYTKTILTYYNDSQFLDYKNLFLNDEEIPSEEFLEQSVDSLIQYMSRTIEDMSSFQRRIRMRKLLSIIELPFTGIDDFSNYIKYSLNNRIVEKEEINFKLNHIQYFLNKLLKIE